MFKSCFYELIFLIMFFGIMTNANGEDLERLVKLEGMWKFTIGDNMEWADPSYDDSGWEEIFVPSAWEDEGFHGYNGYAWYRKSFDSPRPITNAAYYLVLGFIDDVDEVYLNGKLIGSTGSFPPNYSTAYNSYRKYPIQKSLLNLSGDNLIAVRVYDSQLGGGIMSGEIGIYYMITLTPDLDLSGMWKFRTGDNSDWKNPDLNDDDWDEALVPSNWESQGYKDYDGFGWYRLEFEVSAKLANHKLVFLLGKIDDLDQAYLNGEYLGSTGNMEGDPFFFDFNFEWQALRGYYIPEDLLKPGKNVITVRVYDGTMGGGIYSGPIGLITQDHYVDYWKNKKKKRKSIWEIFFGN